MASKKEKELLASITQIDTIHIGSRPGSALLFKVIKYSLFVVWAIFLMELILE